MSHRRLQAPDRQPREASVARTVASWVTLVGSTGREYDVTTPGRVQPWGVKLPGLDEGMTIEGKQTVVGYLGWVLPDGVRLRAFRYQLELGPDVAEWTLVRRAV